MKPVLVGVLTLGLAGCGSVVRGSTEQISFQSDPVSEVHLTNGLSCQQTPCTLEMPRKDDFVATFTKPGFAPEEIRVTTAVSGAGTAGFAGNLLAGGLIGMGVDAYTGSSLDHHPNPVIAHLRPIAPSPLLDRRKGRPVS